MMEDTSDDQLLRKLHTCHPDCEFKCQKKSQLVLLYAWLSELVKERYYNLRRDYYDSRELNAAFDRIVETVWKEYQAKTLPYQVSEKEDSSSNLQAREQAISIINREYEKMSRFPGWKPLPEPNCWGIPLFSKRQDLD